MPDGHAPEPEQPEQPGVNWWGLGIVALLIAGAVGWVAWAHRPVDKAAVARLVDELAQLDLGPPV